MWLKEGDQNTKYFHSLVKEGSSVNKIFSIQDRDGVTLTEKEQINGKFVRFFIDLLGSKHENVSMDRIEAMLDVIPKLVLVDQNSNLVKPILLEKVKSTLFWLGNDKALGLDGFPALFFQKKWDILGKELWEVVEESRARGFILKDLKNTFIALVPKKKT